MSDWIEPFVSKLWSLAPPSDPERADRATLAHLRRGLGQDGSSTLSRVGWLFAGVPDFHHTIDDAILVAGLFATHPEAHGKGSVGTALKRLRDATSESVDRRLVQVVDSVREDLPERLRHAVKLLKANDIPVDYVQLLRDLARWDHPERHVQWNWSRDYWRASRPDDETSETSIPEGAVS